MPSTLRPVSGPPVPVQWIPPLLIAQVPVVCLWGSRGSLALGDRGLRGLIAGELDPVAT